MITFYPNDLPMWEGAFDFQIVLVHELPRTKMFYTLDELFEFLKEHGIRFDNGSCPVELKDFTTKENPYPHPWLGYGVKVVHQLTTLGWVKLHPM